jgi:hypothetical protein
MKAVGLPAVVSRTRPSRPADSVVILTPDLGLSPSELQAYPKGALTIIAPPKWMTGADPVRRGFVRKMGMMEGDKVFQAQLKSYAPQTRFVHRKGPAHPLLRGVGGPFVGAQWRLGKIDSLRSVSGQGWSPLIVDEAGNMVLAQSTKTRSIWLLADPDLLNNQGLASRDTARVAAAILTAASDGGDRPLIFDVTLNGYERARGLLRLILEPPWVAATLIAAAAAVLMGIHALARFGQPRRRGRAFALGVRALVDNSADLVRMARKEAELAPDYAQLTRAWVLKAAGGHTQDEWLDELARRRGATAPSELEAEARQARTRDDLLEVARKLYAWRGDMTRERR